MNKKILGIIGGLGPMATAYFLRLVIEMTEATTDQEHIETVVLSRPSTPDRTKFILGYSDENPLEHLLNMENDLCSLGAKVIAMPCITAHYFQKELENNLKDNNDVIFIDGIYETALYLSEHNIERCGIMATDGTIESGLFQNEFEKYNISSIIPKKETQKLVMDIIYNNVKENKPVDMEKYKIVSSELRDSGAQVILLGCTELSMAKRDNNPGDGVLDVLEVLARKAVLSCGKLKSEYCDLITK